MGRTVMAFSQVMESEREGFRSFRRALSKEDQEAFDRLFDRAKMHTSAGVYMSHPWPMETILLSICLEHGKMIEEILGLLKEKKKKGRGQEAHSSGCSSQIGARHVLGECHCQSTFSTNVIYHAAPNVPMPHSCGPAT